ncbi:CynX/NimT family MFS transporter [Pseudomonas protegens]|uniref:CynX/NimT family MFS transporter n=1 Tax=Pseudomonas protegens TaxID=380021 RepID=UPI001F489D42|nr:CynX/NimT family MFS transporter [Pseudomonas protegens]
MPRTESTFQRWAGWALLVCLGLNLRPILSSVSPLLNEIRGATGMSFQSSAWLTSLPVICMGLVALLGVRIEARLGERRGVSLGLLLVLLACLVRLFFGQAAALLATALLGGAGVALIQALVPALIKRQFQHRVALAMGVYSASLMGGGGIAALLSPQVASHFANWQVGLGVWVLPAMAALLLWACLPLGAGRRNGSPAPLAGLWNNRRAWLLALYFGLVNCGYMSMVAWLPAYYLQMGWSASQSGSLLAFMTLFQVSAALLMPALAQRSSDRRPLLGISLAAQAAGFLGLVLWPLQSPHLWVALIGFGLGACFALSLILTLDHRRDPREAGQLTAFVQGVGFLINAVSPWLSGWLRQVTGSFVSAWWVLIVGVLAMLLLTRIFSPASYQARAQLDTAPQPA